MADQDWQHLVVIIGGAVAGSEAAFQLTQRGVLCVVVEQNDRPYGKVEDGLPRWHEKLRLQEEKKIDEKLSHPAVHFVPRTKVGVDLTLEEILSWDVSAVVFANGAWRDRPLPLPGIDQFIGKGFCYQNPLVYMFNHYLEPDYRGPLFEPVGGALVVGGGLGSLDVVKILMLETVVRALEARGKQVGLYELEHAGIRKGLGELGLTLSDLRLKGCTLIYRRRTEDMPVAQPDENATPEQMETTRATRRKLLNNFAQKYLFNFQSQRMPVAYLAEDGCLKGLRLAATEANNGRLILVPGSGYEFRSPLVVSSIGSIPEPVPGIQMDGEVYRIKDESTGEVEGHERVFAVGNAVTGRGNILASRRHGRVVSQHMIEHYLQGTASGYEEVLQDAASEMAAKISAVARQLAQQAPPSPETVTATLARVKALQKRVGYSGTYAQWIERVRPPLV
jgi:NADPH-dependent glutamate synthase beta subunit-like oxidoreductase